MLALLPVIFASFFTPGQTWTWDYLQQQDNQIYSSERYTVIATTDNTVTLEMSTQLPGQKNFQAHHRLEVNIEKCLQAYRNPAARRPWSFRMFYKISNQWKEIKATSTLAFEEKFNCNPHRHNSREFLTLIKDNLFQHRRWRVNEGTWFPLQGPPVAQEKLFPPQNGSPPYVMRLRAPN